MTLRTLLLDRPAQEAKVARLREELQREVDTLTEMDDHIAGFEKEVWARYVKDTLALSGDPKPTATGSQ